MNTGKAPPTLLQRLLNQGDRIEIVNGRLAIKPASGRPVPNAWITQNHQNLVSEIINKTKHLAIKYLNYSTGNYGISRPIRAGGVTLELGNATTGEMYYAIFNAIVTRSRTTKHGKAGERLPNGQFKLNKKHDLYKLWIGAGLEIPRGRPSAIHDYMGNLKPIFFTGKPHPEKSDKIIASSLTPLNIPYAEIKAAFTDNHQTSDGQLTDNGQPTFTDKNSKQTHYTSGIQPNSTTCVINCDKSKQGKTYTSNPIPPSQQSEEEWLEERDNAPPFLRDYILDD